MFWWFDSGVVKRSEGRTRDLSETGAFVLAGTCPPEGIPIGFKVFLPPISGNERNSRLEAEGHVLRVERPSGDEERDGFAVLVEHIVLQLNNDMLTDAN